jgi:membrane protein
MAQRGNVAKRIRAFFAEGLWQPHPTAAGVLRTYGITLLRMAVFTVRGCRENQIALRASALTLYSLLAIVPVAAMAFGIAQGFGFDQRLQAALMDRFAGQEEVLTYVITFARSLLDNTRGGVVAGIGVAALFWAVVKVMGHTESALNYIWKVDSRTWERRLGDYLAVMLIGPLLLITASSATVYLQTQVTAIADRFHLLPMVGPAITLAFKLGPYLLMWILFSLVYGVMPNTRVRLGSALLAGILAGSLFQLVQWTYIDLQLLVSNYNAVYGSFAALPLFLIWLQLSWVIVLVGAEVGHTHQHRRRLSPAGFGPALSHRDRQLIALRLCRAVVQAFEHGRPAPDEERLAEALTLPEAALQAVINTLLANGILTRVVGSDGEPSGVQPGRDPRTITVADLLNALDMGDAGQAASTSVSQGGGRSQEVLAQLLQTQAKAPANIPITEI